MKQEKKPKKPTQAERVLRWLTEFGSITPADAYRELSIMRLSARIYDLCKDGHEILSTRCKGLNRWKEPVSYCRYSLVDGR